MVMRQTTKTREPKTRTGDLVQRGDNAPKTGDGRPLAVERRPGAPLSDSARMKSGPLEETGLHRPQGSEKVLEKTIELDVESLVGRRVGQYRLDSVLGRGTMAWVFKAKHLGLGRPCALKVMDPGLVARQPGIREQFWAEARAAANLLHPHVVTIHNLGSVQGIHFIEMEYIRGGRTLRESLVRDGPLEPVRAATLARQVVLALGAAHQAGLVHRDIKPANVLLTPDGRAKLADFGLVRRLDEPTDGGAPLAGTPTFMAPELFRGTPASPRSDFYALGVLLFHALSGRLPFTADNIGQLIRAPSASGRARRSAAGRRDSRRPGGDRREMPGQVTRRSVQERPRTGRCSPVHDPQANGHREPGSRGGQRAGLLHSGLWRYVPGDSHVARRPASRGGHRGDRTEEQRARTSRSFRSAAPPTPRTSGMR